MPRKKLQVFISSTFLDLQEERQAAVSAILKAGHIPAGMELFTSGDESQWETITRWIDESDIYMLILGGRYGSTHPTTGQGYTEMEYDYAVAAGKPYFSIVIEDVTLDEWVKTRGKDVLELVHPDKLKEFRSKVLSRTSSFFADKKDIKLAIHETIPVLDQKHNPLGWISGADFTDTKPLVEEISRRSEENSSLQKEVSRLQKEADKLKAKSGDEDFTELRRVLSEIEIDVSKIKAPGSEGPDKLKLLQVTFLFKEQLVSGITNQMGISPTTSFLFHTVCPKLQIYELAQDEKVAGARFRRYALTARGRRFIAAIQTELLTAKNSVESNANGEPVAKIETVIKKARSKKPNQ